MKSINTPDHMVLYMRLCREMSLKRPLKRLLHVLAGVTLVMFSFSEHVASQLPPAVESGALMHMPTPEFAPDLTFKDDQGKTYTLDDYLGKAVLLHFWATWCPTCREEMVALDRLKAAFADKPLAVLCISVDESDDEVEQLQNFFKDKNIKQLKIFLEPSLNSEIIPTTYLIDKKGNIFAALSGPTDWSTAQNINMIRKALGEQ